MRPTRRPPGRRRELFVYAGGALALAVCCAGPLLVAALAVSGAGAWLVANGALFLGGVVLSLAVGLASWIMYRVLRTQRSLSERRPPGAPERRSAH